MNIKIQCCGIAILVILLFFFSRQNKLRVRTTKVYAKALWVTLSCVILDIISIISIKYMDEIPIIVTHLVCKLYLISLLFVGIMGLLYVCADIFKRKVDYERAKNYICGIAVLISIAIFILPIKYHIGKNSVVFTEGPSVLITYAGAIGYVVTNIIMLYRYRDKLNKSRYNAAKVWMIIWLMSGIIQFMFNSLLIVGFASCIGLTIVYIKLENPDNNLDRKTGIFNQAALNAYLSQCYYDGLNIKVLFLQWSDSDSFNISTEDIIKHRKENLKLFYSMGAEIFRYTEEDIVFVFDDEELADKAISEIQEKVKTLKREYISYVCRYEIIYFSDISFAEKPNILIRTMKYIRKWNDERISNEIIYVDDRLLAKIANERKMEKCIEAAIEDNSRVEVYYQPIYSINDNAFTSAEALVRLKDDDGNIVMPGEFIWIAEKNGSILQIGEIVFEKVCAFLNKIKDEYTTLKYIEVNLSVLQCADEFLTEKYISIMNKYQINPEKINLEITESAMLQDRTNLIHNMKRLKEHGVRFSLDDFGTGASNLNYIVDMPVDIIKFDRGMIKSYFENEKAKYVMEAALLMIRGMKLEIVSEGIETGNQYEIMKKLSIEYIQGYFFSKPLPQNEYCSFLSKHQNRKN